MSSEKINIIIFVTITTVLILLLGFILILVIYLYQQRKLIHTQSITELELSHEKSLTTTQLEIQENLFRHISQEIHDNVGLTLSLVKLRLNTLDFSQMSVMKEQVFSSVNLLGESIENLRDISRSLNADIINNYGLIQAIHKEITRIEELSNINITLAIDGEPIYMDSQKELIIFRIIQESCNNILKHSGAKSASVNLKYTKQELVLSIQDGGKGFSMSDFSEKNYSSGAGIRNMTARSKMIRATMLVSSAPSKGTTLKFTIPI
ncbi:ATP-binding protein [Terrimonas sp. NA20]|uniref:histidine kinase n=1 Tax=Terrimonas ginsenosidimutans TaxID=2908004 RepID=A0ABS9KPF6_9BACT|nr:ATP-binding protein [Terrimonas ginsenosidimutans]MCG2614186.1 ATP-binding protein [Terrimonas ginsenosidimutans]